MARAMNCGTGGRRTVRVRQWMWANAGRRTADSSPDRRCERRARREAGAGAEASEDDGSCSNSVWDCQNLRGKAIGERGISAVRAKSASATQSKATRGKQGRQLSVEESLVGYGGIVRDVTDNFSSLANPTASLRRREA
ncbi:hypothetical protein THAOC_01750 [Thalassiosira oceanica]|uniref:Uncharacterized protein n=1 Tax=Thalassiosira oceanica TaxID=159749 RepID=K0TCK8_THAOC|nr:hypothetical protein THAOC_01750 [Thalassiosira oceanica]|eukprot:EJK76483.1 hypothetical protein THAOC_01750 [Thalassiosira oceanica]